jgi:hypothetical protein
LQPETQWPRRHDGWAMCFAFARLDRSRLIRVLGRFLARFVVTVMFRNDLYEDIGD